jgi:hypothetical protein
MQIRDAGVWRDGDAHSGLEPGPWRVWGQKISVMRASGKTADGFQRARATGAASFLSSDDRLSQQEVTRVNPGLDHQLCVNVKREAYNFGGCTPARPCSVCSPLPLERRINPSAGKSWRNIAVSKSLDLLHSILSWQRNRQRVTDQGGTYHMGEIWTLRNETHMYHFAWCSNRKEARDYLTCYYYFLMQRSWALQAVKLI